MTPRFRVVADGKDITALINDRLLLLKTTDKPGMESDDFELRIDDRDSAVALPKRGAGIEIYLGYAETSMARLGRYMVDEVEISGPPNTIVVRGKAGDMRGTGKTVRSGSWEDVPLSKIVADVAARNGWTPVCNVSTNVPRADQLSESDFNFITRIAKQHDCTAKVADGKLIVMTRDGGRRIAAFIAQVGHESGHLTRLVESLNYRADRIVALGNAASPGSRWRSLVPRAAELAGSSARMGNAVYGGRMGNGPEASGEGYIYRGRGLIQITGKDNHRACGEALGVDLINHPELLEQPQYAALSAAWYWSVNGLNTLADAGDIQNIGSLINTGSKGKIPNGAADRLALYQTALRVLA